MLDLFDVTSRFWQKKNLFSVITRRLIVEWAFKKGRKKQNASKWYKRMKEISGVDVKNATLYDFQRFFKCTKKGLMPCRDLFFPKTCSSAPCNQCPTGKGNTIYF